MQYQPSLESRYYPIEDKGAATSQEGFKTHLSGANVGSMDSRFLYLDNQQVNSSVQTGQRIENSALIGGIRSEMGTGWQYVGVEGLTGIPSLSSSLMQSFSSGDQLKDMKNLQSSLMAPINAPPFHSIGQSQLQSQSEGLSLEGLCLEVSAVSFDSGSGLIPNQSNSSGNNVRDSGNTSNTVYDQVNGNGSYLMQLPSQPHQQLHLQTQQAIRQQQQQQLQTHQHHLFHEALQQQNHHQKQPQQQQQQYSRYSKQSQMLDRDRADRDKIEKDRAGRSGKGVDRERDLNIAQNYTDTDYVEDSGRETNQNQFNDSMNDGNLYDLKQNIQLPTYSHAPKKFMNHQDKHDSHNNNNTSGSCSSSHSNNDSRGTLNITGGNCVNSKNSFSLPNAGPKEHVKSSFSNGRDRDSSRGEGDLRQSYEKCNQTDRRGSNTQGSNHQSVGLIALFV